MMSTSERLVYMINQIALNMAMQSFAAASRGVADHIALFWDPRMKAQLLASEHLQLDEVATEAVRILREKLLASHPAEE